MAKAKLMDSAKELEAQAKQLFERIKDTNAHMGATLEDMRHMEGKLIEKERIEEKERLEALRIERLKELANSTDTAAYHSGEPEEMIEEKPQDKPETEPESGIKAETEPDEAKIEQAKEEIKIAEPVKAEPEIEKEPEVKKAPAPEAKAGEAKPQPVQDKPRTAQAQQPRQDRPQQPRNDRFQQPRQDRPQQLRNDRAQQPRTDMRSGDTRPQQPRNDRFQQPRQQEMRSGGARSGGFQQRRERIADSDMLPAQGRPERTYDANKKAPVKGNRDDERRKNKKTLLKEAAPSMNAWDEDGNFGGRKKKRQQAPAPKPEPVKIEKAVITSETITVKELSEKIGKPVAEIIKKLFILGIMATINQEIDFDTCSLIASDYDIELEQNIAKSYEDVLLEGVDEDESKDLVERPPVVTIMGHVDHGKTSLLDAIRHSSITEGEAGGITQHIGAYTVTCNGRQITFIDTPGHEAFTAMRARGAQVTDIVILVVAADDGIMPQTVEAINHSKAAGVPIIVAINKMDKPTANPDRVKQQLTEYGLVSEEWGGDTICVPVSAKTKQGLDNLLEMVLLQADVLELKANPNRMAKGIIIEAELDKGRGPIATVLVQNGTLKVGDPIVAGMAYGRVRAMMDDKGRRVTKAGPSTPVEVLGFNEVPSAGDMLNAAEIDKLSRQVAEERRDKLKAEQLKNTQKVSLDDLFNQIAEGQMKDLNIIIKADVQGSVEAVRQALEKLSNDEVRVKCIHGAVGAITDSDVIFASASNAIVIGFNVRPNASARALAEKENVDIRLYRIIYNAIEDIQNAMKGLFKPVYKEVELGRISVRNTFKVSGVGTIAGAYVQDGKVSRNAQVRVVRDGIVVHEGRISSLKRFKDDVKEVAAGYECGIGIENFNDIHEGDTIEAFVMEEVKR
ncbi:MAG: translation initiation factor IF-2 [Clostridiales bacterium]|nr:translation initiation factor IF-2 [Clostridiales bacterium]